MSKMKKTSNFAKFRLLMWKNWLLQWRHKLRTVVEILAPVIFSAILVIIRGLVCYSNIPLQAHTDIEIFVKG